MAEARKFDLVLFGATGFTGGLTAEYLAQVAKTRPLRWALAGRNANKLQQVRARLGLPEGAPGLPELLQADATDARALGRMAASTKVVITTVGPYTKHGEPLVAACAEAATDYVDLTGEPFFIDIVSERYHDQAQANRVKIVNACGFDSVPHDLGAYFTLQALRARLPQQAQMTAPIAIEGFVRASGTFSGGTLHSALEIMSQMPRRPDPPRALTQTPTGDRKVGLLPQRVKYRPEFGRWSVPMPTIDPEVVLRSAQLMPEYGPDFRYGHYSLLKNLVQVGGMAIGLGTVFALAQFAPTKALLKRIKDPGEGPDEATRAKSYFKVTFIGRAAHEEVRCEVSGGDPGYGETAKMLAESALCLAFDHARLPQHFGVVTPASAMGQPLIDRLRAAGIVFREL